MQSIKRFTTAVLVSVIYLPQQWCLVYIPFAAGFLN